MALIPLLTVIKQTIEQSLNRLPPWARDRLLELRRANPDTPLSNLPPPVRAEVKSILTSLPAGTANTTVNNPAVISRRPAVSHRPAPNGHTRPQPRLPDENTRTVLGTDVKSGREVTISLKERLLGFYVIGSTGTGKTTLDLNMILSDIRQNFGVCLIEPHSSLTRAVIAAMPEDRLNDVLYLDLADSTSSFGLNFFECPMGADDTEVAKVASFVMHVFEKVWQVGPETPRLAQVLRNTTRVLIENPGMTFAEIPLLLWDDGVREKLVRRVMNTQTKLFWSQYNRKQPRDRDELTASTINKVDAYLNEPLVNRLVSQSASTIDFRRIMDEGKILLVNLSPQLEEASRLIGALVIGRLLMAAFSRSDTPNEDQRRPFFLYCDEFQRFATSDFATFLAEARKFKIGTTISNQTLEQLDDLNRATALQAGSLVVMRVSGSDSKDLAPSFDATPTLQLVGEEPIRATPADPIGYLVRHSSNNPTVATFVAQYLMPLESLLRQYANSPGLCNLGCAFVLPAHLIAGHRELNEAFATCMRERLSDVFLTPWSLFCLGGAAAPESTYVYFQDLVREWGYLPIVGIDRAANPYGRPGFLAADATREAELAFLRAGARTSIWNSKATIDRRVAPFVRMLRAVRETLVVLAKDPILVDTGQYQPKYQLRTYADQENLVANDLSRLPNYTAKVRLLSGEHTIRTNPAPKLVSELEVEARIRAIKERMLREGFTTPAAVVDEEVRKRQELLRRRPDDDAPPPIRATSRHKR